MHLGKQCSRRQKLSEVAGQAHSLLMLVISTADAVLSCFLVSVEQALDQLYMTNVMWLTGLWDRTCQLALAHPSVEGQATISSQEQASMAVRLLDSFGYLQPAHMRLSIVSKAVSDALLHVSSCPKVKIQLIWKVAVRNFYC